MVVGLAVLSIMEIIILCHLTKHLAIATVTIATSLYIYLFVNNKLLLNNNVSNTAM